MIIDQESRKILEKKFENEMKRKVSIYFFTSKEKEIPFEELSSAQEKEGFCMFCDFVRKFLDELKEISKEKIEVKEFELDSEKGKEFNIERIPTILIDPENGYRIKYVGAPVGEEAWAFIDTIVQVSKDESNLSKQTKEAMKGFKKEAKIEVFVTPQCPYCPFQVFLANNLAIEAKGNIESVCIEALENPDLADKYNVSAVPHTVINEKTELIGVQSEQKMVEALLKGE